MRLIYAVFVLLLVLMTSAQCQQTAKDFLDKGNTLFYRGSYNEAIQAYEKAIELNTSYALAWGNKGTALYEQGMYEESLEAFNKVIEIDPQDADAWKEKGMALSKLGRYEDAIKAYDEAIRLGKMFGRSIAEREAGVAKEGKKQALIALGQIPDPTMYNEMPSIPS